MAGVGLVGVSAVYCVETCDSGETTAMIIMFVTGAGLVVGSAVYDIIRAPASVRRYNSRMTGLSLRPHLDLSGSIGITGTLLF